MKRNYFSCVGFGKKLFSKIRYTFILPLILLIGFSNANAQEMTSMPGVIVEEPIPILKDANSRVAMAQMLEGGMASALLDRPATADIQLIFGPGAIDNQEVMEAFEFAAAIWSREIVSSVPIMVNADFATLGTGVLASAGPLNFFQNFPNAPEQNVFYPVALANSLAGVDLAPGTADLVVNLGNGVNFSFGTDGNPPAGTFDFVTIALHELGHGLGFIDGGNVNATTGIGDINGGGAPLIFDLFVVDSEGNSVLDIPNPSIELGDFYVSGDVFVNGEFAVDALDGNLPEVFAPNPFQGGSSIAHWDEATFPAGDPNSLMSPQVAPGESIFDIGAITRGHFRDMGWVLADQSPVAVIPGSITEVLNSGETITIDLTVNNITDSAVNVNVTSSDGAVVIGAIDPATFTLEADGSTTVSVEITAENAPGGFFDEVVTFTSEGSDLTFTVPVSVQVLDGTEAPTIVVNPESFNIALEQGTFTTEALQISNTGNADLDYSITVTEEEQMAQFRAQVIATNKSIAANGIKAVKVKPTKNGNPLAALQTIDGVVNEIVGDVFAADFEDFNLGEVSGQMGWVSRPANTWNISDANPFDGSLHIRGESDGSGATPLPIALTPNFIPGNTAVSIVTAQLNIEGSGVAWELIPQNTVEGSVVTRLRFNGDGSVDVLDANAGAFVPIEGLTTPEGYFTAAISIDRDTFIINISINGELVYTGAGFASTMNNIVLASDFAVTGSTLDVDNIEVSEFIDENAPFVSVNPSSGTIVFGEDQTLDVFVDARTLDTGVFNADLTVSSNDPEHSTVVVPVTLTVTAPASIVVSPLELTAEVDVAVDNPAVDVQTFTITNNGGTPLEFSASEGLPTFTSPNADANLRAPIDRSIYGGASAGTVPELKKAEIKEKQFSITSSNKQITLANTTQVVDSLFLDSGINFPPAFVGFDAGGPGLSAATLFTAPAGGFTLTAVRNGYRTEDFGSSDIILQVFAGGATPDQGQLLAEQAFTDESVAGVFAMATLDAPLRFNEGETFWIAYTYPMGIDFPQGFDDTITNQPNSYAISADGGVTYNIQEGFAFLTRALSTAEDFITLSPSSGTVNPGEEVEVTVTFEGTNLENGLYESDITVASNDPINSEIVVATDFTVTGQTSAIVVSEELLLFNDVFVNSSAARTFTITNTAAAGALNVSSISSDNDVFTASPSSATVGAGESLEVIVTFSPTAVGSANGLLTIVSDADNDTSVDVILNGVGVQGPFAVLDPELTQATVPATESVDVDIVLRNEGESPLTYSFPELAMAMALANSSTEFQRSEVIDFGNFSSNQSKGFTDTRKGAAVEFAMGTDTGFGYTWIDSDATGGPVNNFFDISAVGLDLTPFVSDGTFADGTASIDIPFAIPFYGEEFSTLFVNANGFVSFEAPTGLTFLNGQIPVEDGVNNIIAPFWGDLEPGTGEGGTVHIAAGADFIIVQWTDVPGFLATGTVTFQVFLFADGTIDIYYDDVSSASFLANATIGIENSGATDGAQVAFNTDFIRDDFAIRFIPPSRVNADFVTAVTPLSGILGVGQEETITVTLDAANLDTGVFFDELTVSSNSPDTSRSTATFELTVTEGAFAVLDPEFNQVTATTGEVVQAELTLTNAGGGTLDYSFPEFAMSMLLADPNVELQRSEVIEFPDFSATQSKGFTDTRIGAQVANTTGADLEFGYTWIDSDEAGGPTNNFFDISEIGTDLTAGLVDALGFADGTVSLTLPFTFPFYGVDNETIFVNANGFVSFEAPTGLTFVNGQIPVDDGVNNIIAPFWTDLEPGTGLGGTVHAAAGPDVLLVQWTDAPGFATTGTVTFQVAIFSDGTIDVYYDDVNTASFAAIGTVGIENTGATDGAQVAFNPDNAAYIRDGLALRFMPPAPEVPIITAVTPLSGSLTAGQQETITVTLDATNLDPEVYLDELMVSSNSRDLSRSTAIFEFTVVPEFSFVLINADTDTAIDVIENGDVIDLADFPEGTNFNIEAIPNNPEIGSIVFDFNGTNGFATESVAPYALGGDSSGDFRAIGLPLGLNSVTATAFSQSGGSGEAGATATVSFEIIETVVEATVDLFLINATTDAVIGLLEENQVIDFADFPAGTTFTVEAVVNDFNEESVVFDFNGEDGFATENIAPYALGGDSDSDFRATPFVMGTNVVTATAYSGNRATGESGPSATATIEFVDTTVSTEAIQIQLINTDADVAISNIEDGTTINLSDSNSGLTLAATVDMDNVGSVRFSLNGVDNFQTENIAPYALNGDSSGNFRAFDFALGANVLTVQAFDGSNASGSLLSERTINFTVVEGANLLDITLSPNPTVNNVEVSLVQNEKMLLTASLVNFSGQTVYSNITMDLRSSNSVSLNVSSLPQGVYILVLTDENGTIVSQEKLVKK